MDIPDMVVALRKRAKMTQAQFAKACGLKTRETVAQYESGTIRPSLQVIEAMAKLSGLSVGDLLSVPNPEQSADRDRENQEARQNLEICLHGDRRRVVIEALEVFSGRTQRRKDR